MARILFQGDSLTDGNRYKQKELEWDKNHQMGHSYAYIVNGILGSRYPQKHLEFLNRGISGNRVIDIYARVNPDIIDLKPDVLSMMVGINDIPSEWNCRTGTAPEKFERLYRSMLTEIRDALPEIRLMLCEPVIFPVNEGARDAAACCSCVREFQEIIGRLAEEFHASHLKLQSHFEKLYRLREPEYWSWDGIHPTENGHGVIAEQWIQLFEQTVLGQLG